MQEEILKMIEEVRARIAEEQPEEILSFSKVPIRLERAEVVYSRAVLRQNVDRMSAMCELEPERDITSDKPGMKGKMITALKKGVRKSMRFYIEPICREQTAANRFMTGAVGQAMAYTRRMDDLKKKIQDHQQRLNRLHDQTQGGGTPEERDA